MDFNLKGYRDGPRNPKDWGYEDRLMHRLVGADGDGDVDLQDGAAVVALRPARVRASSLLSARRRDWSENRAP